MGVIEFVLVILAQAAGGMLAMLVFKHVTKLRKASMVSCRFVASLFSKLADWVERRGWNCCPVRFHIQAP